MAAYGLYTHIASNKFRSMLLLAGLFVLIYVMVYAVTGGEDVTRQQQPRLYNLLENLCISRGIPMPKLKIIDSDALNAFATGLNQRQYAITVPTGLLNAPNHQESEAA